VQGSNLTISIPKGAGTAYFTITDGTTTVTGPAFIFLYTSYITTIAGSLDSGTSATGRGLYTPQVGASYNYTPSAFVYHAPGVGW